MKNYFKTSVFRHPEIFSYFKFPKIYENQEICFSLDVGKYKVNFRIQLFIFLNLFDS